MRMNFIFTAYESGLLHTLTDPCDRDTLIKKLGVGRTTLLDALLKVGLAVKELMLKNEQFSIKDNRGNRWRYARRKVRRFMPGSTFYGIIASKLS